MRLLRMLLAALAASAGLVLLTQVPAAACSCAATPLPQQVADTPVIFVGTLTDVEETPPGDDGVISSGDLTAYSFDLGETLKGDPGEAVVSSARDGGSCGLEGMRVGQDYVVFAYPEKQGLGANLCGGTAPASSAYLDRVRAALDAGTGTTAPVPTQVPSGVESVPRGAPGWVWFAGGVGLALVGGGLAVRLRWVRP